MVTNAHMNTSAHPRMRVAPRRYVTRRRARRAGTLVLASVAAALAVLAVLVVGLWSVPAANAGADADGAGDVSTPRSEWRAGEVPYLYQTDPAWADHPYAGGAVEKNGCGPTCLSMVYVALTGRGDLDPAGMADFSERGGHTSGGMTSWTLMTDGAAELGLSSKELPADASAVSAALRSGTPVICSVRPGDFTTTGHFIVLAGMTGDGRVVVRDPNSAERSSHPWDLARVLDQCANLWALSA